MENGKMIKKRKIQNEKNERLDVESTSNRAN